jgi:PHD/YefM family antitoxin component YafN of YafNO toxin-antitoxin module
MNGTLEISQVFKQLNSIEERLRKDCVIYVTRNGDRAFALVDIEYLAAVTETMEALSDPNAMRMLQGSLDDILAGRLHSHDVVEKELG